MSFENEPTLELRRAADREPLVAALAELDRELPLEVPVLVGGDRGLAEGIESTDPGSPTDPSRAPALRARPRSTRP